MPLPLEVRYSLLRQISLEANAHRDLSAAVRSLLECIRPVVSVDAIALTKMEKDGTLGVAAVEFAGTPRRDGESVIELMVRMFGDHPQYPRLDHLPFAGSSTEYVWQTEHAYLIEHLELPGRFVEDPMLYSFTMRTYVRVPLIVRGTLIGSMLFARAELVSGPSIQPFTPDDVEIFEKLAPPIAATLANTLALEEIAELHRQLAAENVFLRDEIDERLMMGDVIGTSAAMRKVLALVDKVAPTEATVLITGETGTGKELIAREIHRRSQRAHGPLIAVHAAALPGSLIASELFGHERGSFTGALQQRAGRFELASKGSIFLDEIGELPPEMQTAMLRVLQERTFERVGGTRTLRTDARVIAATNRDLTKMIAAGTFRDDLYYRLSVFPIEIPPLRDRAEDIPLLVEHFVTLHAKRLQQTIRRIPNASMQRLAEYAWPGNVRELENVIERAVILSSGDALVISPEFFPKQTPVAGGASLGSRVDALERTAIETALIESSGRIAGPLGAAARLGLRPTTLYSKIRKYRLEPVRLRARETTIS